MGRKEDWVRASAYSIALKETWPGDGRPRSKTAQEKSPLLVRNIWAQVPPPCTLAGSNPERAAVGPKPCWYCGGSKGAIAPGCQPQQVLSWRETREACSHIRHRPRGKMALFCVPSWLQGWWSLLGRYCSIASLDNDPKLRGFKQHNLLFIDLQFGSPRRVSLG